MKPVDQTLLVERDGMGDCLRACVASILERPIGAVPLCDREVSKMLRWLDGEGFETDLFIPGDALPDAVNFAVLSGPSPRRPGGGHAVVGRRNESGSFDAIHDPHPSRAGLGGAPDTILVFWLREPSC